MGMDQAQRLQAATEARRVELGVRWRQICDEAGLSHQTLSRWRNGAPVDPLTERRFEKALHWAPGARDAIAAGKDPEPLEQSPRDAAPKTPTAQPADDDWRMQAMRAILEKVALRDRPAVLRRLEELMQEEEAQRLPNRTLSDQTGTLCDHDSVTTRHNSPTIGHKRATLSADPREGKRLPGEGNGVVA